VSKSFRDWLTEGEAIYNDALQEFRLLESQIHELESRLMEKKNEVNQIAQMIGKPPVQSPDRLSAEIIDRDVLPPNIPLGTVTRALTGRGAVAR
jgi:hypothetical protein